MMKTLLRFARLAPLALLFAGVAGAQTTSTITGTVTDGSTGKGVVGAVVVATTPGVEKTSVTDAAGAYTFSGLAPGQYNVSASLEGYKTETRVNLVLGENVTLRTNLAIVPEAVQMEEVVVTGSRIRRKDLTTAAPVSVVNKEAIAASGQVSVGEFLQNLPEQSGALGRGNNNGGDGTVQISLRGLGAQRTLVLVNGRRWVAGGSGANDTVDLNTLPASAIERIEILKDGASAVYGSDAIGGVVNVITRKGFTGAEVSAFTGTSSRGDGTTYDVSGTIGTSNDKGSLLFTANYTKQNPVWAGDRSWSANALAADYSTSPIDVVKLGSGTIPNGRFQLDLNACPADASGDLCRQLRSTYYASSPTTGTLLKTFTYDPNGTGQTVQGYRPYSGATDSWNYAPFNYLYTPSTRFSFFTSGDYKLTDWAKLYFEGSYMNRRTAEKLAPVPLVVDQFNNPVTLSRFSQYNPFGMDIKAGDGWQLRSRMVNLSNRTETQDTDTVRVVAGLNGSVKSWFWDASYVFGRTAGTDTKSNVVWTDKVAAALGPSRNGVCYTDETFTTAIGGCTPLDLLHGPAPANQVAGIAFTGPNRGYTQQSIWAANLTGELFPILADRPVGLALGAEFRTEQGAYIINPLNELGLGSDYNSQSTQGGYNAKEAFAELSLPIINNVLGAYDLEASLAGRISNYSTYGSNSTYKAGLRYSPVRDVTVRGTYSTAYRAPSVSELYGGNTESFPSIADPCAGPLTDPAVIAQCGAAANNGDVSTQMREALGGNAKLKAETANIFTLGLVLEPRFADGLSMTVDYYDVHVKKTVNAIGIGTILNGCYPGAGGTPNAQYCALIQRNAVGFISRVDDTNQNVGELMTSGIDVGAQYNVATEVGRFLVGGEGTILLKDDWLRPDGSTVHARGTYDYQYADPKFKGRARVQWTHKGLTAGVAAHYIGGFKECGDADGASGTGNLCADTPQYSHMVKSSTTFDLNLGYTLTMGQAKTNLAVGVTNFLDSNPPLNYNAFANAADTAYDYMGRFFYARLTQSF